MDVALLLFLNLKSDIFNRTQCNYMTLLLYNTILSLFNVATFLVMFRWHISVQSPYQPPPPSLAGTDTQILILVTPQPQPPPFP